MLKLAANPENAGNIENTENAKERQNKQNLENKQNQIKALKMSVYLKMYWNFWRLEKKIELGKLEKFGQTRH